jgi:hypothetical protein
MKKQHVAPLAAIRRHLRWRAAPGHLSRVTLSSGRDSNVGGDIVSLDPPPVASLKDSCATSVANYYAQYRGPIRADRVSSFSVPDSLSHFSSAVSMCAQLVKVVVVFCMLLSPLAATPAAGAIIFSEDFSSVTSPDTEHLGDSEKWGAGTKYLFMPSDLDWIFSGDAVLVIHPTEADQAMALNETGGMGQR